jgi:tetratricopeptide (TPR) repeat protein
LEPVFHGKDREDILRQIASTEPLGPRSRNKAIPAELETIVLKAMEKEPWSRYASAQELADDLQRFLDDKVVSLVSGILGLAWSNLQIRREQEQTETARQRAEDNLALAIEAIDDIYLRLGEERLPRDSRLDVVDADFLARALRFYDKVTEDNRKDPRVRRAMATAWNRVGYLRTLLGQHAAASDAYRRSIALSEPLVAEYPNYLFHRWNLAASHQGLGHLFGEMGNRRAAGEHCRLSLELWTRLAIDFPSEAVCQRGLANIHTALAAQQREQGNLSAAEQHNRQALALMDKGQGATGEFTGPTLAPCPWPVAARSSSLARHDLATSHHNLANVLGDAGKRDQAEQHYRQALALESQSVAESPGTPLYQFCLALTYRCLGDILRERNRTDGEQAYQHAVKLETSLLADFPSVPDYREALADSYNCLGILAGEQHDLSTADGHFRKALEIRSRLVEDFPLVPRYRQRLANSHTNLGKRFLEAQDRQAAEPHYRQALELQSQLTKEFPNEPHNRHDLALTHSHLADLLENAGDWKQAEEHYRQAVSIRAKLAEDAPAVVEYQSGLATCEELLGNLLCAEGEEEPAKDHFRRARDVWTRLVIGDTADGVAAGTLSKFARFLANCPAEPYRDAGRAVALARQAVERAPAQRTFWTTLGLALYRSGDRRGAITALDKARELRKGSDAIDGFIRAMARVQLGDKEEARQWYDNAVQFPETHQMRSEHLRRFRIEAMACLGLDEPCSQ